MQCFLPTYLYTNGLFGCLLLAVFTDLSSTLKLALCGTVSVVYLATISVIHLRMVSEFDKWWQVTVPSAVQGVLLVVLLLLLLTVHSVRLEWYRRAQFLWSNQTDEAVQSSTVLHHKLTDSMYNLMPESAFAEYLDGRLRNSNDQYCVSHKRVAVLFVLLHGFQVHTFYF